ncbi:MAG: hypothetical protein HQL28_03670 [Candidatus Omnitrophica bacterium]|nr:hypothetical protein [Candidatus Omnitrophota bacterium]
MIKRSKLSKGVGVPLAEFNARIKNTDLNTYFIFGAVILVFVVGMYAIFSPQAQNERLGNPACGKIVVAADGPTLNNNVSPTLAEARYFLVVNPLSKKLIEAARNPYRGTQTTPQLVYLVAGKGEEALIVGGIDPDSYNMLMQFGIRVFGGYQGRARSAMSLYRKARISQATQNIDAGPEAAQVPVNSPQFVQAAPVAQAQQPGQGMQAAQGWGGGQGGCTFMCPNCKWAVTEPFFDGRYPTCPTCRVQMMQQGGAQAAAGFNWNAPDLSGRGPLYPNNQFNNQFPVPQMNFWQGGNTQGAAGAAWGVPNYGMNPNCQFPMMQGAMGYQPYAANQAAFGFGQQAFVCPNCNWRLKCARQGNAYPTCPNCASPMATDMSNSMQNWKFWQDGQWAADMTQLQPQFNQSNNQPNFWQGQESTGFFTCPNCNWRMFSQQGANQYPQCPNCKQIMARSGAYYQNQNTQNNQTIAAIPANGATQAASKVPAVTLAPDIPSNSQMGHVFRGVCSNCHKIINVQPAGASTQAATGFTQAQPLMQYMGPQPANNNGTVDNQNGGTRVALGNGNGNGTGMCVIK